MPAALPPLAPDDDWHRYDSAEYIRCPNTIARNKACGKLLGRVMQNWRIFVRRVLNEQDGEPESPLVSKCPRCHSLVEWRVERASIAA